MLNLIQPKFPRRLALAFVVGSAYLGCFEEARPSVPHGGSPSGQAAHDGRDAAILWGEVPRYPDDVDAAPTYQVHDGPTRDANAAHATIQSTIVQVPPYPPISYQCPQGGRAYAPTELCVIGDPRPDAYRVLTPETTRFSVRFDSCDLGFVEVSHKTNCTASRASDGTIKVAGEACRWLRSEGRIPQVGCSGPGSVTCSAGDIAPGE